MILKITVPERNPKPVREYAQTLFVKVVAIQESKDEIKYFLKGENLLKTDYWLKTSNFCVENRLKEGHFLLTFEYMRYDEQWCEERCGQGIRVLVEESDSFPCFESYPISQQKEVLDIETSWYPNRLFSKKEAM
jgi:hypothetical protein